MIYLQPGLYVTIEQLETELSPPPKPLRHGFSKGVAYLALGAFSLSESSEAFFILSNDRNEIWFISNRHLRTYCVRPEARAFRLDLNPSAGSNGHAPNGLNAPRAAEVPLDAP